MASRLRVCLQVEGGEPEALAILADRWNLQADHDAPWALVLTAQRLELRKLDEPKLGAIFVDFVGASMEYRRRFGGGRREAIAKAVGIKRGFLPDVVDATAGLGRDAFVLASLGCTVQMYERHPVVAALLDDGLQRAYRDAEVGPWAQQRLKLSHLESASALTAQRPRPHVVYLDPMYPPRAKTGLVKKEMRVFQELVGTDPDAAQLLAPARALASKRVVVKRPRQAPTLADTPADAAITTKGHRFDLYLTPLRAEPG